MLSLVNHMVSYVCVQYNSPLQKLAMDTHFNFCAFPIRYPSFFSSACDIPSSHWNISWFFT